jgi:hypothetical protein
LKLLSVHFVVRAQATTAIIITAAAAAAATAAAAAAARVRSHKSAAR